MAETASRVMKVAIIAGEESGDILGADLVRELKQLCGRPIALCGVGGSHLEGEGLKSYFDPNEIALMGFSAVLARLPKLIARINSTARMISNEKPDVLIIIDSPDFTHRVAKKVKVALPSITVVNYVCPSVWAWRQGRARKMRAYIDHILAILPFEPAILAKLGGPPATYVGHRMATDPEIHAAAANQKALEPSRFRNGVHKLLLLPGSRRSEIENNLPVMNEVVRELSERIAGLQVGLATLPHLVDRVKAAQRDLAFPVQIVTTHEAKMQLFSEADAALAASGTVTLETALSGIPTVAFYKTDLIARYLMPLLIKSWSISLPNLIADEVLVADSYNEQASAGRLVRQIERLLMPGHERSAQLTGFDRLREKMSTEEAPGKKSAAVVLQLVSH